MGKMQIVYRDGKRYEWTPGDNGSLVHRQPLQEPLMNKVSEPITPIAKTIATPAIRKKLYTLRTNTNGRQVYDREP